MGNERRIGVMLDIETAYWRHTSTFSGLQKYADEQQWEVVIDEFADDTLPTRSGSAVPYDGVIARATRKLADRAERLGIPVVNVWLNSPVRETLPGVFPDCVESGRLRAEHLMSRGHTRFAAISCRAVANELETESFCRTLEENGFSCPVCVVSLEPSRDLPSWRKAEQRINEQIAGWEPPIGVHVGQEMVGRMLAQLCRGKGWRVPEDVSIIAGFNEATICEQPRPSLTSVELGGERIGYESARLLHRLMDRDAVVSTPQHILLPPVGLVVRESTDFHAVEDSLVASALSFIATHSHRKLNPSDVARAVSAELRTLQLKFRKAIDRPIAAEIRRVRIERAKRELVHTNRRLDEIARDVGFGKAMRMYEVFRREVGQTPSAYRKQRKAHLEQ